MSETTEKSSTSAPSPTLTMRGGGWVIVLAIALVLGVIVWATLAPLLGKRHLGDGHTIDSYGFGLEPLLVERSALQPSGNARDFLPALDVSKIIRGSEQAIYNESHRSRYVVSKDRVFGLVHNGEARAYPIALLNGHEVINDVLGGDPIVVAYSPFCDAPVAFLRTVDGTVLQFNVSGLLCESSLLCYDRAPVGTDPNTHAPSLWSPLLMEAISGPYAAKGTKLSPLTGGCTTTWSDWLRAYPMTTMPERDLGAIRRYKTISYARNYLSPRLDFPVDPIPTREELAQLKLSLKSPCIAVFVNAKWHALSIERLLPVSTSGVLRTASVDVDGVLLDVVLPEGPGVARVHRRDGQPLLSIPCLLFAYRAFFDPTAASTILPL
ncbi:MAG: DUF3179 domain-containing protein [Phycisphaerales bacterium]|nr:DUF3179 domain-containing protein [Phycisphaerales bacterium]